MDHHFQIRYGSLTSDIPITKSGVPQKSINLHILFKMYASDLITKNTPIIDYGYDKVIISIHNDLLSNG